MNKNDAILLVDSLHQLHTYKLLCSAYLVLSDIKPWKNCCTIPKSLSSVAHSIPLVVAIVRVSPNISDINGLDKPALLEDNNRETVIDLTLKLPPKVVQNISTTHKSKQISVQYCNEEQTGEP